MSTTQPQPTLSVVVIIYDMAREARRTLHSLSTAYQQGIPDESYEVIVVDNGSPQPLGRDVVEAYGNNFSYHYLSAAEPSPVQAVNHGLAQTRGRVVGVMVDGARLLTPGLLHHVELASRLHPRPIIAVPGWHLGPKLQSQSILEGYDRQAEDDLLDSIHWPDDGYRLFEISTLAASNREGCFRPLAESNALFLGRAMVQELGGYDQAFRLPGGGLCNLDYFERACALQDAKLMVLLGEGTFHQVHGGETTGDKRDPWPEQHAEYQQLRQKPYRIPALPTLFLGHLPSSYLPVIEWSARRAREVAGPQEVAAPRDGTDTGNARS